MADESTDQPEVGTQAADERFRPGGPGVGAKGGPDEVGSYDLKDPADVDEATEVVGPSSFGADVPAGQEPGEDFTATDEGSDDSDDEDDNA